MIPENSTPGTPHKVPKPGDSVLVRTAQGFPAEMVVRELSPSGRFFLGYWREFFVSNVISGELRESSRVVRRGASSAAWMGVQHILEFLEVESGIADTPSHAGYGEE